ncbi:MAG: HAD-IIIA family hydrolase [Candidatus Dactylopiibacterium sp.]|nr:HAD-IIIA family hydrolase [Candidatus Dactylopiibacterium sp.]
MSVLAFAAPAAEPSLHAVPAPREPAGAAAGPARAAVFVDKDGSLTEDVPFSADPARLRFTPNALRGLRLLHEAALPVVVVTNQPGLALGRFSRAEFMRLEQALRARVEAEAGLRLAGVYVCPHAPTAQGGASCLCRKPAPGLLRQAAAAGHYDLARSWMIGDILDDIEAGRRAGCRTILLDLGGETTWRQSPMRQPHYLCADLLEAARIVVDALSADPAAPPAAPPGGPAR